MSILEFGINFDYTTVVKDPYYIKSEDVGLDSDLRARFFVAINNFVSEVLGDDINVIGMGSFRIVCYIKEVSLPAKEENKKKIVYYCFTEKDVDSNLVKELLAEVNYNFLSQFTFDAIFRKSSRHFRTFKKRAKGIFGDLALNTDDRFRGVLQINPKKPKIKK